MKSDAQFHDLLGVRAPILQAPMAGATTPRLAAAVSAAGGLGGLGLGAAGVDDARRQIRDVHELGATRVNVNFFLHRRPSGDDAREKAALDGAARVADDLGIAERGRTGAPFEPFGSDMLDMVVAERPSVVTFHFGVPDGDTLSALHDRGIVVGVSATTCEEAELVERAGCDFVIAQGAEAGGHRGQFDAAVDRGMIGTFSLVPQMVDAVTIPVVAAGGIADGRGLAAARALGAAAVQVGTAFLLCEEASVSVRHRRAISEMSASDTSVTTALSGRPARAIRTAATAALEAASPPAEFPVQFSVTAAIRAAGLAEQPTEAMWAGQSAPLARPERAAELVARLVDEATKARARA